ncbi:hypothetical protein Tco_0862011 [Tanacetum coccineum]
MRIGLIVPFRFHHSGFCRNPRTCRSMHYHMEIFKKVDVIDSDNWVGGYLITTPTSINGVGISGTFESSGRIPHIKIIDFSSRREGQDTQEELEKRDLKAELEERERKHFSSKEKGFGKD